MPSSSCPGCGRSYSLEEWNKSKFCSNPKCGAYLTKNSAAINPKLVEKKTKTAIQKASRISTKYLPEKFKAALTEAHAFGVQVLETNGIEAEPLETALMVEEHRWFWKPRKVKFILVAESHVRTSKDEVKAKIDPSKLPKNMPKDSPLNFVKLVYCLAYGEPYLLMKPDVVKSNAGTRQYIDLFKEVSSFDCGRFSSGLEYKVGVLRAFKAMGLWLLDASVHACYLGKGERLPVEVVNQMVSHSWEKYVRPIIDYTNIEPSNVWIVGKGLHDLLWGKYISAANWIYQPNAQISSADKNWKIAELKLALKQALEK